MPGSNLTYAGITDPVAPFYVLNIPAASISAANDTIDIGVAHNFATGNHIWFSWWVANSSAGTSGGITPLTKYFVIVINSTTIKLASSLSNANSSIAIDITSPFASNISGINIFKYGNPETSSNLTIFPERCPAYAKSDIIFNSSIPVEINFTIPTYLTSVPASVGQPNGSLPIPLAVLFKQEAVNACWGLTLSLNPGNDAARGRVYNGTTAFPLNITFSGLTLGYNQRYVINTNRQVECWYAPIGSSLILVYTSTAITANTSMRLEFGSNFSFARVTDCTIKYL